MSRESKMHIFNTSSPASKTDRQWVPHTVLLCGREFHLGSDFLAAHPTKLNSLTDDIICKTCLKRHKRQQNGNK